MEEQNIWEGLNLSEDNIKTAYDYLSSQADNFKDATKGELLMDVETSRVTSSGAKKRQMTLYYLYIVAPQLGNFRKKLIHIAEFDDQGRFPINLYSYVDDLFIENILEEDFLSTLKDTLARPAIKLAIENLFKQSIEAKKRQ